MNTLLGIDRSQISAIPITLDEMIPEDHPVRVIETFIVGLSMQQLGFAAAGAAREGRPTCNTKVLLKLFVLDYLKPIRTSRLLERECTRNIELMWLLGNLKRCFRTIAGFRSCSRKAIEDLFKAFV